MNIADLLSGLRPLTEDCCAVFEPFYAERAKHYAYPRYLQSVFFNLCLGGVYWKIINFGNDKVLLIIRKSSNMGSFGLQINLPPISLSGNAKLELSIMQLAYNHGISLKVDKFDIQRYKIPIGLCSEIEDNIEFIYDIREGALQKGAKFRKARNRTNKVMKTEGFKVVSDVPVDGDIVVRNWFYHYQRKHGERPQLQIKLWDILKRAYSNGNKNLTLQSVVTNEGLEMISAVEHLSDNHHLFIFRCRNYQSKLNDVNFIAQWINCNSIGKGYANIGEGGDEGLRVQKESLNPCAKMQIYRMKSNQTLDKRLKTYFK